MSNYLLVIRLINSHFRLIIILIVILKETVQTLSKRKECFNVAITKANTLLEENKNK